MRQGKALLGFLATSNEGVFHWTQKRGLQVTPYGLDFSEKLVELARQRLPDYADNIFVGNAWDWTSPQTFDYVNTTLDYVPDKLREAFVHRLLKYYVRPDGCLLVSEYLGRNTEQPEVRIDETLRQWGFAIEMVKSSHLETDIMAWIRVAVIRKSL